MFRSIAIVEPPFERTPNWCRIRYGGARAHARLQLNSCTNLHCSRRMLTLAAPRSCAVTSSTNAFNDVGCHHAPLLPRSNPHIAPRHDRVPLPAVSFLGGFRTPAPSLDVRGPSVIGRHPKPLYEWGLVRADPRSGCPIRWWPSSPRGCLAGRPRIRDNSLVWESPGKSRVRLAIVCVGGRCVEIGTGFFVGGFRLDCQRRGWCSKRQCHRWLYLPGQLRAPRQVREGVCRRMVGHQHPCFFLQRGRGVVGWPVRQAKLGCGNHVGIAWSRISEPDRLVPSPHASPLRAMDQKSGLSILI